jgi:hypothetical protein
MGLTACCVVPVTASMEPLAWLEKRMLENGSDEPARGNPRGSQRHSVRGALFEVFDIGSCLPSFLVPKADLDQFSPRRPGKSRAMLAWMVWIWRGLWAQGIMHVQLR